MRQPRLCALTQYTRAIDGRARSNPITPATHLSHAFREALPNYTCFGLLRFGSRNNLCFPLFSLSLSQGYFPVPRKALLFVWHFWKLPSALPSPTRRPLPRLEHRRRRRARPDLHLWIKFLGLDVGGLKRWSQVDIKQVIFTVFKSAGGEVWAREVIRFHSHVLDFNLRCTCKNLPFFLVFFFLVNLFSPVTTCGGDKKEAQCGLKIKTKVMFADPFVGYCAIYGANISWPHPANLDRFGK